MLFLGLTVIAALFALPVECRLFHVTVRYPAANLAPGTLLGLRGSPPLSWTSSAPLDATATDTWEATVAVDGLVNATTPVFEVDLKVIAGDAGWQLGCNHRFTLLYSTPADVTVQVFMYPFFFTTAGQEVTLKNIYSPELNNSRDVWLYIPPGMVENSYFVAERVLIMHDGQNLAPLWNVSNHLDKYILQGLSESVFVVGPYNTPNRIGEYTYCPDPSYGGGQGDLYLDFIEKTLLPLVASQYKIATKQENLGIMGSSLGGLISCYAGVTRPHVYSTVACMSSSFWWAYANFSAFVVPQIGKQNYLTGGQKYYLDSGDSGDTDDDRPDTSAVATGFVRNGFTIGQNFFWFLQRGGQHNEYFWSSRFHHPMQWLYFRDALWNGGYSG
jgi:predicted alpha/beta superfamily hydrolase